MAFAVATCPNRSERFRFGKKNLPSSTVIRLTCPACGHVFEQAAVELVIHGAGKEQFPKSVVEHCRWVALILALGLAIGAMGPLPAGGASKLKVVTATSDLAALAMEVGGDRIEVDSIARSYQDPHSVEAKPSFLLKLRQADLLIVVGLQLESGWLAPRFRMPSLIAQSGNPRIQVGASGYFDVSQYAEILEIPTQVATRAMGGVHLFGNPHYLLDPENGRRVAQAIVRKLSEMRPDDAAYFHQHFQGFSQ